MATMNSTLVAGTVVSGGQGGSGKGHCGRAAGLVTTAALDLALLGGLSIGKVHRAAPPVAPPAVANPIANYIGYVPGQFTCREDHRAGAVGTFVPDQFTYHEDHR